MQKERAQLELYAKRLATQSFSSAMSDKEYVNHYYHGLLAQCYIDGNGELSPVLKMVLDDLKGFGII